MTEWSLYLIKSSLCLVIFYLFFKILLSKDTFFRFNRIMLLGGTVVSLALPLLAGTTRHISPAQRPLAELEEHIARAGQAVIPSEPAAPLADPAIEAGEKTTSGSRPAHPFPWLACAGIVHAAGLAANLLVLFVSVRNIRKIIRTSRKIVDGPYILYLTPHPVAPFSWHRYVVMSEADYRDYPQEILAHEKAHIRKRHTLDLVFMEAILLFQWFNPAAWLLKRELKEIHEYEADDHVIRQGIDATQYQLLLVKKAVGKRFAVANSFNHSKIKNRITMMLKEKSNRFARLKPLFFIPLAAGILHVAARPEANVMQPEYASDKPALTEERAKNDNSRIHFVIGQEQTADVQVVLGQEQTAGAQQKKGKADYYVVNGVRMKPDYFEQTFLKACLRTAGRKEDLTDPKGKIVESHGVRKKADGTTENTPSLYLEITSEQEKELLSAPSESAILVWFHYKNQQENGFNLKSNSGTAETQKQIEKFFGQSNGEIEKIVVTPFADATKESTEKLMKMLREKAAGQNIEIVRQQPADAEELIVTGYRKKVR